MFSLLFGTESLGPEYFHIPFLNHLRTSMSLVNLKKNSESRKKWMLHKHFYAQT